MGLARVCVFTGPSLPIEDRLASNGLTYLAPASRGDVARAAQEYDAILLIDGVFHHDLAPSPKEVLAACRGVRVFGAASVGALRAAECWPFGVVPLGTIARWYIREIIDGDDEVAVRVHPDTHVAQSVPSVNVRFVASIGRNRGILTNKEAGRWIAATRTEIFYADRSWDAAIRLAPRHVRRDLYALIPVYGDLVRLDANLALRHVLRLRKGRAFVAA